MGFEPVGGLQPCANVFQQAVGGTEEDEPLQFENVDPIALLTEQLLMQAWADHGAVVGNARKRMPDDRGAAIVEDKQPYRGEHAEANAFQDANAAHHDHNQADDGIIGFGEFLPTIVKPFYQETQAQKDEQSAEQWPGQIGQYGSAEDENGAVNHGDAQTDGATVDADTGSQEREAEGGVPRRATRESCQTVGNAGPLQFAVQIHIGLGGDFNATGVEK